MRIICATSGDVGSGSPPVTDGEAETVGLLAATAALVVEAWITGATNAMKVKATARLRAIFLDMQRLLWQRKCALRGD